MEVSRIFWDTNLFVYLLEGSGPLTGRTVDLRRRMVERGDALFTSALTLGELLVKPVERGDDDLRHKIEEALQAAAGVIPFDSGAARHYAAIRRDRAIRPPDAIQLACAAHAGVDLFVTNDDRLAKKSVAGIDFIVSLERAFL